MQRVLLFSAGFLVNFCNCTLPTNNNFLTLRQHDDDASATVPGSAQETPPSSTKFAQSWSGVLTAKRLAAAAKKKRQAHHDDPFQSVIPIARPKSPPISSTRNLQQRRARRENLPPNPESLQASWQIEVTNRKIRDDAKLSNEKGVLADDGQPPGSNPQKEARALTLKNALSADDVTNARLTVSSEEKTVDGDITHGRRGAQRVRERLFVRGLEDEGVTTGKPDDELEDKEEVMTELWTKRLEAEAIWDRGFWESAKAERRARMKTWELIDAARKEAIEALGVEDFDLPEPPAWASAGLSSDEESDQAEPVVDTATAVDGEEEETQDVGARKSIEMPRLSRCGRFLMCLFHLVPLLARLGAPLIPGGTGVVVAVDAVAEEGTRGFVYVELQQGLNRMVKLLDDVRFTFDTGNLHDDQFKQLIVHNLVQPLAKLLLRFDLNVSMSKGVKLRTVEKILDINALRIVNKRLLALVEHDTVISSKTWNSVYRSTNLTFLRIQQLIKSALEEHPTAGCFVFRCCFSVRARQKPTNNASPPPTPITT